MKRSIQTLCMAAVLVAIGLAAGWFAARQNVEPREEEAAAAGGLSPQTLKNMGVTVAKAQPGAFVRTTRVQAMVVDRPLNMQPVTAPLGGIVVELHVKTGDIVEAGEPVVTLVRESIARPDLKLTADILTPVSESMHDAALALRTAIGKRDIAQAELARVEPFVKEGTLSKKTLIDIRYDLRRADREVANARGELEWHGLSDAEIDGVARGANPPGNRRLWKRALERNDLWGEREEALFAALPPADRQRPWAVAAIGELSAAGLVTDDLLTAVKEVPHLAGHFVETASLLLSGQSVERLRLLGRAKALQARIVLRAPPGAPDYDVAQIAVRVGQKIAGGHDVAVLHDARRMWLRVEPLGGEVRALATALTARTPLEAEPLLEGTGPALKGLVLQRLDTRAAHEERGSVAFVEFANQPLSSADDSRSWGCRVGLRYLVRVPVETMEDVFVLPSTAVTDRGPDRVVLVPDGKTFLPEPVHVLYQDEAVVVIANDGSIVPGDAVVMTGAFALGLALQDTGGGVDPHAGHSHG